MSLFQFMFVFSGNPNFCTTLMYSRCDYMQFRGIQREPVEQEGSEQTSQCSLQTHRVTVGRQLSPGVKGAGAEGGDTLPVPSCQPHRGAASSGKTAHFGFINNLVQSAAASNLKWLLVKCFITRRPLMESMWPTLVSPRGRTLCCTLTKLTLYGFKNLYLSVTAK